MPTDRRRHLITETDDVARAIDDAARVWALRAGPEREAAGHARAVERTAGRLTGVYDKDYLARLRVADLGVQEVALGAEASSRLARMRAELGLKLPDCCVLEAARDAAAERVLTFDSQVARAAESP